MKKYRAAFFLLILTFLLLLPGSALAQTYYFGLDKLTVDVFLNGDGTATIHYLFAFSNNPGASPIEYVDVGLPNSNFDTSSISAEVDGIPLQDISRSGYQGEGGSGVAVGLGSNAIRPGERGVVQVTVGRQEDIFYADTQEDNYASTQFAPTWFGSQYVDGLTDMTVSIHMPPGVQPEEPRWHEAPAGWPSEPERYLDSEGRPTYTWNNPQASATRAYVFGASFPMQYIPETAIVKPGFWETLGIDPDALIGLTMCCGFFGFFAIVIVASVRSTQRRKLQYLPPKIAIEGHGIKRGLTAVEAALLLEEPLDKVLTMILFGVVKKNAAKVVTQDPLKIEVIQPEPEFLNQYEKDFIQVFQGDKPKSTVRGELQTMMVDLVKSVTAKMKGFSRKETIAYYRDISTRAWQQVEAAGTPEVKSAKFDENLEWTMLDKEYDDRTRRVFTGGPVFLPTWWGRYDPVFGGGRTTVSGPASSGGGVPGGGGISLPNLPGAEFAASVVRGTQNFAGNVIGSVTDFTDGVTQKTNPVPVSTTTRSSGGRSGGGCACACACAGCACACAGGGR